MSSLTPRQLAETDAKLPTDLTAEAIDRAYAAHLRAVRASRQFKLEDETHRTIGGREFHVHLALR